MALPSNTPTNVTILPRGHRSTIDPPIRAAVPQAIQKTSVSATNGN